MMPVYVKNIYMAKKKSEILAEQKTFLSLQSESGSVAQLDRATAF